MNVGNLKIQQWIITKGPEIVSHYIQYYNKNPFDPIQLNCAVEAYENMQYTYVKLTSHEVYNNNYFDPNSTKRIQI